MSLDLRKWISVAVLCAPSLFAADLSQYRDFQLGMNLTAVEKQAETKTPAVKTIHQRPALIQDMEWHPRAIPASSGASESVKDVLLSFYNGRLFRIVANYDRYKTEGMTEEDLIAGISATYGPAARPTAEILFPSLYSEMVKVIARWEDSDSSINLVRSSYQPNFALVVLSKQLEPLVKTAIAEADRMDAQEGPQREAALKRQMTDAASAKEEKARSVNMPSFRP